MTQRRAAWSQLFLLAAVLLGWALAATGARAVITETRLTTNTGNQTRPAIWGNYVVFQDDRAGASNTDIWMYDVRAQTSHQISRAPGNETRPDICEHRIVWEDRRNASTAPDIYMYDLSVDTDGDGIPNYRDSDRPDPDPAETCISVIGLPPAPAPGVQQTPRISESYVVWDDRRSGTPDIFAYDLATRLTVALVATSYQVEPSVWGSRVVWTDYRNGDNTGWDIYMYDLASDQEHPICTAFDDQNSPSICGDRIAWEDFRYTGGDPEPTGDVFIYDLASNTEIPVVTNSADQWSIALSHDWLAYLDDRRSTSEIDYSDVYMYDFRTGHEIVVLENEYHSSFPDAYWNRIVYQDNRFGHYDIFMTTFSVTLPASWSLMSIPYEAEIGHRSPGEVLGSAANNALYRWDLGLHSYIVYDPNNPALFGDMTTGQGYWLNLVMGQAFDYAGERYTSPRQISLPTADWHLIGPPFDLPVSLAYCKVENVTTHETVTFDQALQQGWIRQPLYYFDPFLDGYFAAGTGVWHRQRAMWPWYGYWFNTQVPNLRLLLPVPSIADRGAPLVSMISPLPGAIVNLGLNASISTQWTINNDDVAWSDVRMDDQDWTWKGAARAHTFENVTPGAHTIYVRVVDKAANIGSASVAFQVNAPPTAEFSWAPQSPVVNQTVQFTDQSTDSDGTVVGWSWNFGDGGFAGTANPTHKFTSSGPFDVMLTATDNRGSTGSVTHTIAVIANQLPIVDSIEYQPENPTDMDEIQFTGTAHDPDGSITAWQWTFGDGRSATGQVVTHDYADNDTYTVTLTVTDNDGGQGSGSVQVIVTNEPPTVSFTWTPDQPSRADTITFLASGTDRDGSIVSWAWNFGDGHAATGQGTTHRYTTLGTYVAVLTGTDNDGATDTFEHEFVIVNEPPSGLAIQYQPSSPTDLDTITFTGSAVDRDGSITARTWDFGDGFGASGQQVTHTYADNDTYHVTFTVTDNESGTSSTSVDVPVANVAPTVSIAFDPPDPIATETLVTFDGTVGDPDGSVVAMLWDFADGGAATTEDATHTFDHYGVHPVTLAVTDNDGAVGVALATVSVGNHLPSASFVYQPAYPKAGEEVRFFDTSVDPDGQIVARDWSFGDTVTGHGAWPRHTYAQAGVYTVTLTVTDNRGATATATATLDLTNAPPSAAFTWTPASPTTADTVEFTDGSTDSDGSVVAWVWYFGDGSAPATAQNPTHQFAQSGTFWVSLHVIDDDGATATAWQSITVTVP